ncbi:MAG: ATP-binding cassette domain-containing protein [Methanobacterium sp.]|jgi:ABC-2 type transport system ATP-binding protein
MDYMVETNDISKSYGDFTAVDSVNLKIPRDSVFGVLGPNGAGKTTLISMLCTILRPTSGTAVVNGFDVAKNSKDVRASIGIVFQSRALDDMLTGREHLQMHASLYGVPSNLRKQRIEEVLDLIALGDKADEFTKTYSGGMKRRLEIGRGLIHHPKLLILDEPTLGLDPQTRENIWEYISKLNKAEDITVLLTTHYMDEADKLCDRIAIMNHGQIIKEDSPLNLKRELKADTIIIQVDEQDRFIKEAEKLDFVKKIFVEDSEIKLMVERGENLITTLVNFANKNDITVNSIELTHPNLEDVFLNYTGTTIADRGA